MTEMTTYPKEELANLEERVKKLAIDKSYLQLIIRLMNRMNAVPGLDNTIENMLRNVVDVIGGTNVILYYLIDGDIHYADVYGERKKLAGVADNLVKKVMETRESIEFEHEFSDSMMTTPEFSKAYTWVVPLLVGPDLVGVFKMESLNITMRGLYQHLPTFFTYAALALKNEILGQTRLKKAYDELAREMVVRQRAEEALRQANEELEQRVTARTAELRNANEQLRIELAERKRMEQILAIREREYRTLLENIPDLIVRYDTDLRRIYVNPAWEKASGLSEGDVLNVDIKDIPKVPHPVIVEYVEKLRQVLATGTPQATAFTWVNADGVTLFLEYVIVPEYDRYGKIVNVLAVGRDLTERKAMEEEIRKLNQNLEQRVADRTAELEAANNELEAFAYSVTHDLRAPLRHIDGFLELLQTRTTALLDEKSRHYMATISDSARHMGMLIDDLLSFSRMSRSEMSKSQVDLSELVQDVIRDFRSEADGREIQWELSSLPLVVGDRAMLRMMLVNLISNALKFTRSRAQAKIEIGRAQDHETEIILFIRDNGVGFDMRYAAKLFGVFQRLHRADEFEGTGIGLANVHRIVSRHGGRVWADGKVDQGATFYFSLPQTVEGT